MSVANLDLTPLEVVTAPIRNYIKTRREQLLICPHGTPYINPEIDFFKACQSPLKLVLIHIGKCGGESIMSYVRCALPPGCFSLFEYHCFNCNVLIKELVNEIKNDPQVFMIISTRDPLDRWAASFNWDYHNLVLSTAEPSMKYMRMIKSFPQVQDLARAIAANDKKACEFGKLEHMGMGASWYLPLSVMNSIPSERTYCIRLENIQNDLAFMIDDITRKRSLRDTQILRHVPVTKGNYKDAYPANTFGNLNNLSSSEITKMKNYLQDDYEVHRQLVAMAHK